VRRRRETSCGVTYDGFTRTDVKEERLSITGKTEYTTSPLAIHACADVQIPHVNCASIRVHQSYDQGHGRSRAVLFSLIPFYDDTQCEVALSLLFRLLSELTLVPTAFIGGPHLLWRKLDGVPLSAKAIIVDGPFDASAVFDFDESGLPYRCTGQRYYKLQDKYQVRETTVYYRAFKSVQGLLVPTQLECEWHDLAGAFTYAQYNMNSIRFGELK